MNLQLNCEYHFNAQAETVKAQDGIIYVLKVPCHVTISAATLVAIVTKHNAISQKIMFLALMKMSMRFELMSHVRQKYSKMPFISIGFQ